jgi:hypothetical protein
MLTQPEQALISKFVMKDKQERYSGFLEKEKTRKKFTSALYHFKDFNWKLFREITGNENERDVIGAKVNGRKNIAVCSVISVNEKYDGKVFSATEAIEKIVGEEGTILIFGNADVVYYESEPNDGRYISI